MALLEIQNLTIDFGGFVAINSVDFSLENGEIQILNSFHFMLILQKKLLMKQL
jgi:hypothetical protein